jgi:hypothetical protein
VNLVDSQHVIPLLGDSTRITSYLCGMRNKGET